MPRGAEGRAFKGDRPIGRIILIRHGETDWNVEERIQGLSDQPLNARGREQASAADAYVRRRFEPTHIWSSDLARCVQTAEALETPFKPTPTLREIGFGEWEGLSWTVLQERHPESVSRYFAADTTFQAPGGELLADMIERGKSFIREADLTTPQGDVVVVGHGGALKGLIISLLDLSPLAMSKFSLSNAGVTVFEVAPGLLRLQSLNQTAHLEREV